MDTQLKRYSIRYNRVLNQNQLQIKKIRRHFDDKLNAINLYYDTMIDIMENNFIKVPYRLIESWRQLELKEIYDDEGQLELPLLEETWAKVKALNKIRDEIYRRMNTEE